MSTNEAINPDGVRLLVSALVGKQLAARPGSPVVPTPKTPVALAEYHTDKGQVGGVVMCDLPLAASLGAALILLPSAAAADAVRANRLPDQLAENCQEVLNVGARWFNSPLKPHVRLVAVHWNQGTVPAHLADYVRAATQRLDVALAVPGYANGTISILTAA